MNQLKLNNVFAFEKLDNRIQQLLKEAEKVRHHAYAPYSKFQVGACLETEGGHLYTGCNMENASFTVGTCAERCAMAKAVSEGRTKFKAVAVVADVLNDEAGFTTPCGACRQFMMEFGSIEVYMARPGLKNVMISNLEQLLPFSFTSKHMRLE